MVAVTFDAILPDPFKKGVIRIWLLNELRVIATEIKEDLAKPTETWSKQVSFSKKVSLAGGLASVDVTTTDKRYVWVSEGTKLHDIVPKSEGTALKYPGTYDAKTLPGVLHAEEAVVGPDIYSPYAVHPGIEPRNFDQEVKKIWDDKFPERMQIALELAADKTGYAME